MLGGFLPIWTARLLGPRRSRFAAGAAILWVASCSALFAAPPGPSTSLAEKGAPPEEPVVVRGWVDSSIVYRGEEATVWISIENHSGGELRELRFVDFRIPGLHQTGPCWRDNAPACLHGAAGSSPATSGLPRVLSKGRAASVSASVAPAASSGTYRVTAVLAWTTADGAQGVRAVSLGPIVPKNRLVQGLLEAARWLKDLALPIVLAVLAYLFRRREEWRSRVQSTWTLMLPKSHQNAEVHYLPVLASASSLLYNLDRWGTLENERKAFYFFLTFLRRMKKLKDDIGGFYFKDRRGEIIAAECWRILTLRVEERLGKDRKDRALEAMQPGESFAVFVDKLDWEPGLREVLRLPGRHPEYRIFAELESRFRNWANAAAPADLRSALSLLRLFNVVLRYEANRPYEFWYNRVEPLDAGQVRNAMAGVLRLPEDPIQQGELARLRDQVEEYLEAVRRGERRRERGRG